MAMASRGGASGKRNDGASFKPVGSHSRLDALTPEQRAEYDRVTAHLRKAPEEIDADFALMAYDEDCQTEARLLEAEYAQAGWEALLLAEQAYGRDPDASSQLPGDSP